MSQPNTGRRATRAQTLHHRGQRRTGKECRGKGTERVKRKRREREAKGKRGKGARRQVGNCSWAPLVLPLTAAHGHWRPQRAHVQRERELQRLGPPNHMFRNRRPMPLSARSTIASAVWSREAGSLVPTRPENLGSSRRVMPCRSGSGSSGVYRFLLGSLACATCSLTRATEVAGEHCREHESMRAREVGGPA